MKKLVSASIYSAFAVFLGLTLSGCQKDSHSSDSPAADVAKNNPTTEGTGDVGGGNGIDGRVLESYRIDVTELEAYKKVLLPIK